MPDSESVHVDGLIGSQPTPDQSRPKSKVIRPQWALVTKYNHVHDPANGEFSSADSWGAGNPLAPASQIHNWDDMVTGIDDEPGEAVHTAGRNEVMLMKIPGGDNAAGNAVSSYQESSSRLNGQLRSGQVPQQALDMDRAFTQKTDRAIVVYRGIPGKQQYADGEKVTDKGFVSTSLYPAGGAGFAENGTLYRIKVPKGTPYVVPPATYGGEWELIFPRGGTLSIAGHGDIDQQTSETDESLSVYDAVYHAPTSIQKYNHVHDPSNGEFASAEGFGGVGAVDHAAFAAQMRAELDRQVARDRAAKGGSSGHGSYYTSTNPADHSYIESEFGHMSKAGVLPDPSKLPELYIHKADHLGDNVGAAYRPGRGMVSIELAGHKPGYMTHEFGHLLDYNYFGKSNGFSSASPGGAMKKVMDAIHESPTYKSIDKVNPGRMASYLKSPQESFARAFMQYVDGKSGEPFADNPMYTHTPGAQWPKDEFAPIASAMDGLFPAEVTKYNHVHDPATGEFASGGLGSLGGETEALVANYKKLDKIIPSEYEASTSHQKFDDAVAGRMVSGERWDSTMVSDAHSVYDHAMASTLGRMYDPSTTAGLKPTVSDAVGAISGGWNYSTSSWAGEGVQHAAAVFFGNKTGGWDDLIPHAYKPEQNTYTPADQKFFESYVKASYEATQERLAKEGVKGNVIGFRGIKLSTALSKSGDYKPRGVESYSLDRARAESFMISAGDGLNQYMLTAKIPVKNILSVGGIGLGAASEKELLVNSNDVELNIVKPGVSGVSGPVTLQKFAVIRKYNHIHDPANGEFASADGGGAYVNVLGDGGKEALSGTLKAISSVHKPPKQEIPVAGFNGNLAAGVGGEYNPSTNAISLGMGLTINNSFVHEYGHSIDYNALGHGRFASVMDRTPEMHYLLNAMKSTPEYTKWKSATGFTSQGKALSDYLRSPQEMFARAYAQWVSERSGDPTLLKENARRQNNGPLSDQWSDSSFRLIGDAMDNLFAAEGLTSSTVTKYNHVHDPSNGEFAGAEGAGGGWSEPTSYGEEGTKRRGVVDREISENGITDADAQVAETQKYLDKLHMNVNMTAVGLRGIIKDGAFKTLHDTGRSGGSTDVGRRARVEAELFGDNPVYGYLSNKYESNQYGFAQVRLKDSLKSRSSFVDGDSLSWGSGTASPLLHTNKYSYAWRFVGNHTGDSLLEATKNAEDWGGWYHEVQVHGGVKKSDIESVNFPEGYTNGGRNTGGITVGAGQAFVDEVAAGLPGVKITVGGKPYTPIQKYNHNHSPENGEFTSAVLGAGVTDGLVVGDRNGGTTPMSLVNRVNTAGGAIEQVTGVKLTPVMVNNKPSRGSNGTYFPGIQEVSLSMKNATGERQDSYVHSEDATAVHEMAHHLDYQLGKAEGAGASTSLSELTQKRFADLYKSPRIDAMRTFLKAALSTESGLGKTLTLSKQNKGFASKSTVKYVTSPTEVFARAMTQYVDLKNGGDFGRRNSFNTNEERWDDAEFEQKIMPTLDALFSAPAS